MSTFHKKTKSARTDHSTDQVEIMNIDSLCPADSTQVLEGYLGLIDIFVIYYDVEARF